MIFWWITGLMLLLAVGVLLLSLLRKQPQMGDDTRAQNIAIARERLAELQAEYDAGNIEQQAFEQTQEELEQALLDDVARQGSTENQTASFAPRLGMLLILVVVPAVSLGLYKHLGSPQYLQVAGPGQPQTHSPGKAAPSMEKLLQAAKQKTVDEPDNVDNWFILGRLYTSMDQYPQAVEAYEQLVKVSDGHPTALLMLADTLANVEGSMQGRPAELILQALKQDPQNPNALWLAGLATAEQGEYQAALDYWQRASVYLQDKPELQKELQSLMQRVAAQARTEGKEVSVPELIVAESPKAVFNISVELDAGIQDKLQSGDVLFVFVRAASGPPMPLAAVKQPVVELPMKVSIGDSDLLRPGTHLSDHQQLKIGARISHSGQPIARSGDLQSATLLVEPGKDSDIQLRIDQIVP